jgi:anti-sigma B factor antagonist
MMQTNADRYRTLILPRWGAVAQPDPDRAATRVRQPYHCSQTGPHRVQRSFTVQLQPRADVVLIAVSGELDIASAPELEQALDQIRPELTKLVIVDLRELEFMDSTGLSIIVRAHQRLSESDCELTLIKGQPQVQRLLDLTGVADRVRLFAEPGELLDER